MALFYPLFVSAGPKTAGCGPQSTLIFSIAGENVNIAKWQRTNIIMPHRTNENPCRQKAIETRDLATKLAVQVPPPQPDVQKQ